MIQPILNQVRNYDANEEYTFNFMYLGAEATTTNTLSIRKDEPDSKPIYEQDQVSLDKNHILPAKTLTNGNAYLAKVRVKTDKGYSEWSAEIKFMCFTTPKIVFDTIDQKQFIYTNDVLMSAVYMQAQGEPVETYQFTLYDQRHVIVQKYSVRVPDADSPTRFSERVKDIRKGKLYYIGLKVTTKHGIIYEQLQQFTAQYVAPSISGVVHPILNKDEGQIAVELFLKQMLGTSARAYVPNRKNDNDDQYTYWKNDYVVVPKENPLMYTKLAMAKASDWVAKLWVMNVQNGVFLDFAPTFGDGQHIRFIKHDDYITCEKQAGRIVSRTRSNSIPGLKLRPFYLFIRVKEYRIEMKIVPDTTFSGDDDDPNKQNEEINEYPNVTKETQELIDIANEKINSARTRLNEIHDSHWQQYITKVNQAVSDARSGALSHYELRDRVMEIDDEYWDYFNKVEWINFWKEMAKAERNSEIQYEDYRREYLTRIKATVALIDSGELSLEDGRVKLKEYSDVYSFILREVIDFNETHLDLKGIEILVFQYEAKYR